MKSRIKSKKCISGGPDRNTLQHRNHDLQAITIYNLSVNIVTSSDFAVAAIVDYAQETMLEPCRHVATVILLITL